MYWLLAETHLEDEDNTGVFLLGNTNELQDFISHLHQNYTSWTLTFHNYIIITNGDIIVKTIDTGFLMRTNNSVENTISSDI